MNEAMICSARSRSTGSPSAASSAQSSSAADSDRAVASGSPPAVERGQPRVAAAAPRSARARPRPRAGAGRARPAPARPLGSQVAVGTDGLLGVAAVGVAGDVAEQVELAERRDRGLGQVVQRGPDPVGLGRPAPEQQPVDRGQVPAGRQRTPAASSAAGVSFDHQIQRGRSCGLDRRRSSAGRRRPERARPAGERDRPPSAATTRARSAIRRTAATRLARASIMLAGTATVALHGGQRQTAARRGVLRYMRTTTDRSLDPSRSPCSSPSPPVLAGCSKGGSSRAASASGAERWARPTSTAAGGRCAAAASRGRPRRRPRRHRSPAAQRRRTRPPRTSTSASTAQIKTASTDGRGEGRRTRPPTRDQLRHRGRRRGQRRYPHAPRPRATRRTGSAQLTLKVPPDQLEPTLTHLDRLGTERSRTSSTPGRHRPGRRRELAGGQRAGQHRPAAGAVQQGHRDRRHRVDRGAAGAARVRPRSRCRPSSARCRRRPRSPRSP